jgi:hypothetical protein
MRLSRAGLRSMCFVLDRLVENAAERLDELLDRRQPERGDSSPALAA